VIWDAFESPLGRLIVQASDRGVTGLFFPGGAGRLDARSRDRNLLAPAIAQLEEFFGGHREAFELELDLAGTPFQRRVWRELEKVAYATTITYTELARRVGRPDIVRGVAAAVGRTPVPIVIPCHRIVAASGALTGYAGGLRRKRALLDLERCVAGGRAFAPGGAPAQLALL
jgi:methylated-DNA-[protein]-cysteine S-methyltransferase